tara:strand:- start:31106 stop:31246 length:141 start_codon:yes stop_codon:yes gene_type:complete
MFISSVPGISDKILLRGAVRAAGLVHIVCLTGIAFGILLCLPACPQ